MRRLLLVLTLTALFVASAVASGSALAQGEICEGLGTAFEAQTTQTLPPQAKGGGVIMPEPFPGQGDENSAIDQDLLCNITAHSSPHNSYCAICSRGLGALGGSALF